MDTTGPEGPTGRALPEGVAERDARRLEEVDREVNAAAEADASDDVTDRPVGDSWKCEAHDEQREVRVRAVRERAVRKERAFSARPEARHHTTAGGLFAIVKTAKSGCQRGTLDGASAALAFRPSPGLPAGATSRLRARQLLLCGAGPALETVHPQAEIGEGLSRAFRGRGSAAHTLRASFSTDGR